LSNTRKLSIACPHCGSASVFYSCEPKCCFNHVCEDCKGTFEPVTRFTGATRGGLARPEEEVDCTEPAVACARCESTAVFVAQDGALVCVDCGAVLELELTEIAEP
jgi:hypothetical protein